MRNSKQKCGFFLSHHSKTPRLKSLRNQHPLLLLGNKEMNICYYHSYIIHCNKEISICVQKFKTEIWILIKALCDNEIRNL